MRTKSDPYIGQVLGDRYMIMRQLGMGGMATVYAAQHTLIGRMVAIKVLHSQFASDESCVKRFMNEGRAAGTLGHPNIVESTDMGFAPDGAPFLVLELLDGCNLSHEITRSGPLPIKRAARIGVQIASALRAAHAHNIIHRDLKPENIFIIPNDEIKDHVKVLDFGISKFLNAGKSLATQQGALMGTPDFMAPEQVVAPDSIDRRIDVYAVGAIMYHMIAGAAPFHDVPFPQIFNKIQDESPPPLGDVRLDAPNELCEVIAKAMAKRPSDRYQDMDSLLKALLPFAGGSIPQIILKHRAPTPLPPHVSPRAETLPASSLSPLHTPGHQTPIVFQQRTSRWALIGSVAAVVAAAAAVGVVLLRDRAVESPAATPAPAAEVEPAIEELAASQDEALALYLDEVERLTKLQRYDVAAEMLEKANAIDTDDAGLDIRRSRVADELETAGRGSEAPDEAVAEDEAVTEEDDPADAKDLGLLYVRSTPKGTVYVDSVPIGKTPIRRYSLSPGDHAVEIRRMGYEPELRTVRVRAKRKARVIVKLSALSDTPARPDAAPAVETVPEPAPVVVKREEPKPPPRKTEKPPPKAISVKTPDPDAIAAPRLPKLHEVDSTKELARALRIIEKEAIDRGGAPESVASGCTAPLARTLFDSYAPGKTIRLHPRKMYYTIVRGARAGNSRDDIAARLKASY